MRGVTLRISLVVLAVGAMAGGASAQVPGESMETVEARMGRPQMSRRTGDREIWVYRDGVRVNFVRGVVVADPNNPTPAPAPQPTAPRPTPAAPAATAMARAGTPPAKAAMTAVSPVAPTPEAASSAVPTPAAKPAAAARVVYNDEARHIRFSLPPAFARVQPQDPTIAIAWVKSPDEVQGMRIVALADLPLPGRMPRGQIPADKLPPGTTVTMLSWHGEQLNVGRLEEKLPGGVLVNLNVLLPVGQKALRLTFAGPREEEPKVQALMNETLATLDVALEYARPGEGLAYRLGQLMGLVLIAAVVVAVVGWARRKQAKS